MPTPHSFSLTATQKNAFNTAISRLSPVLDADKSEEKTIIEKSVETAVNTVVEQFFTVKKQGNTILVDHDYPFDTDGVITVDSGGGLFDDSRYRLLIETKVGKKFSSDKKAVAETLAQCIAYLRAFRKEGWLVPRVIIIADEDEIFYTPTAVVSKYMDGEYQWGLAPSSMKKDTTLVADLVMDNNISPYVHNMSVDHFDIERFLLDVSSVLYGDDVIVTIPVTVKTMTKLFMDFNHDVFGGVFVPVDNQTQLKIFYRALTGGEGMFLHPEKHNILVLDGKEYQLGEGESARAFEYFWNHVDTNYTLEELGELTAVFDQGLEDTVRRFHGDFFTPTLWVDRAHQMISDALGDNWRDEYVVVDPACGTKNLTRDYEFSELYSMTLHGEELDVSEDYNKGSVAVQYDFLNDDVELMHGKARPVKGGKKALAEWEDNRPTKEQVIDRFNWGGKLPQGLVAALKEKKPIVFFANPPYGQAVDHGGSKKSGISSSKIKDLMPKNYGHAKQELYTQFIYRLQLLAQLFDYEEDFHFFFFFNKGFLTSPNFGMFTKALTKQFTYKDGFMMNAGEFQGTSSAWGIIFSHWDIGGENQRSFTFDVLQSNKEKTAIEQAGSWTAHMVDKGETISDYLAEVPLSKAVDDNAPLTKNGLDVPTSKSTRLTMYDGWIGYLHNNGDNVQFSEKYIGMYSMGFGSANGRQVSRETVFRAALTFSVRRSVQRDVAMHNRLWIQDKDIFRAPSSSLGSDSTFLNDCLVYSLFDTQSNQTSLRDYQYNGNTYQVYNEFFPWSASAIDSLATTAIKEGKLSYYQNVQRDIAEHGKQERLVHTLLEDAKTKGTLSKEAQNVLDSAWELIEQSFHSRHVHNALFPRYQSMCWDAGWLSIRTMLWGRDRVGDDYIPLKAAWDNTLWTLGNKIAQRAYKDGIIADPASGATTDDGLENTTPDTPISPQD